MSRQVKAAVVIGGFHFLFCHVEKYDGGFEPNRYFLSQPAHDNYVREEDKLHQYGKEVKLYLYENEPGKPIPCIITGSWYTGEEKMENVVLALNEEEKPFKHVIGPPLDEL